MTRRRRLKQLVRTRAAKTGESYTSALRHFRLDAEEATVSTVSPLKGIVTQCSFCGKQAEHLKKLIAGPGIAICDECVGLCVDILAAEDVPLPATTPPPPV